MWAGNTRNKSMFNFEMKFDTVAWREWIAEYWTFSILIAAVYVPAVFIGIHLMKDRKPFNVRYAFMLWNVLLGVFSIAGALRTVPVMANIVLQDGWHPSLCNMKYFWPEYIGIWAPLFVFSKVPELGDSAFIILKKQKMQFLHWYHHATVLICCFYLYGVFTSISFWFLTMNFVVHSLMYPYFAFRAAGFRPPRPIAMFITTMQVLQMVAGLSLALYASKIHFIEEDRQCDVDTGQLIYTTLMYFSYMILFLDLFYRSYIRKSDKIPEKIQ